jgi:hypothetical protein
MSRNKFHDVQQQNVIDIAIAIAIILVVIFFFGGCTSADAPPKNGEYRIFWSQDSLVPHPVIVRAVVPYAGANPEQAGYEPVTP